MRDRGVLCEIAGDVVGIGLRGDGAVLGWQWRWSGAVMGNVMSMCG